MISFFIKIIWEVTITMSFPLHLVDTLWGVACRLACGSKPLSVKMFIPLSTSNALEGSFQWRCEWWHYMWLPQSHLAVKYQCRTHCTQDNISSFVPALKWLHIWAIILCPRVWRAIHESYPSVWTKKRSWRARRLLMSRDISRVLFEAWLHRRVDMDLQHHL